jgi:putative FmdB family regulatory protein
MPTYEYACQKCGHEFEHFQSMSDPLLKKCPKCGKPALKRLVGAGAGLIFKGSGFYITDYKDKSGKPDESKTPSATVTTDSKTVEAKSKDAKPVPESKPAAPAKASASAKKK